MKRFLFFVFYKCLYLATTPIFSIDVKEGCPFGSFREQWHLIHAALNGLKVKNNIE